MAETGPPRGRGRSGLPEDPAEAVDAKVSQPQFANGHSESPPSEADLTAALTTGQPLPGAVLEVREVLGGPGHVDHRGALGLVVLLLALVLPLVVGFRLRRLSRENFQLDRFTSRDFRLVIRG